jgi:hypothetical protein
MDPINLKRRSGNGSSAFVCLRILEGRFERPEKAGTKGGLQFSRSIILEAERVEAFGAVEPLQGVEGWCADHQ